MLSNSNFEVRNRKLKNQDIRIPPSETESKKKNQEIRIFPEKQLLQELYITHFHLGNMIEVILWRVNQKNHEKKPNITNPNLTRIKLLIHKLGL